MYGVVDVGIHGGRIREYSVIICTVKWLKCYL